jgi:hypothetical protein
LRAARRRHDNSQAHILAVGVTNANVHRRCLVVGHRPAEAEEERADVVSVKSLDERLSDERFGLLAEQLHAVVAESSYAHVEIEGAHNDRSRKMQSHTWELAGERVRSIGVAGCEDDHCRV